MRYLLDTNVLSDLRRGHQPVVEWADHVSDDDMAISAVTLGELWRGILLVERRDRTQARQLRSWFEDHVVPEFADRTLPIDTDVAVSAASFHVPDPLPTDDAYIAATAFVHDLTVVTRNVDDFARTGVTVVDPWRTP